MESGHPVALPGGRGSFVLVYLTAGPNSTEKFGPVLLWQSVSTGQIVQLTNSISSLDKVLRIEAAGRTAQDLEVAISQVLQEYRGSDRSHIVTGDRRTSFLLQLKRAVSNDVFEKVGDLVGDLESTWSMETWEVSFYVVTTDGAVERWRYSGCANPFSLTNEQIVLVAPAGTVPRFPYDPSLGPGDVGR